MWPAKLKREADTYWNARTATAYTYTYTYTYTTYREG